MDSCVFNNASHEIKHITIYVNVLFADLGIIQQETRQKTKEKR